MVRQLDHASRKYGPEQIYVCSFTRAAAHEIASRVSLTCVNKANIGTIHGLCSRALGKPTIAETLVKEWNEANPGSWTIKGNGRFIDEMPAEIQGGHDMLQQYNQWRTSGAEGVMPPQLERFAGAWQEFKDDHLAMDFTDLLMNAPNALENGKVLFVDETQDLLYPTQWQIVRQWGSSCDVFCIVGDPDQLLYQFLGASPAEMMKPLPEENMRILSQSHRIPKVIHAVSQKWIRQLGDRRIDAKYLPTAEEGEVTRPDLGAFDPGAIVRAVENDAKDGSVMVLASCSYILKEIIEKLRDHGVPFANPYRQHRGDWNPLGRPVTAHRIASFLRSGDAIRRNETAVLDEKRSWEWIRLLKTGKNMERALWKKHFADAPERSRDFLMTATQGFSEEMLYAWRDSDLKWVIKNLKLETSKAGAYAALVAQKHGAKALLEKPKVITGTIHSVKGGEADAVYLLPDISKAMAMGCIEGGLPARDAIVRMAYVGMTRAKRKLVLCQPRSKYYFEVKT